MKNKKIVITAVLLVISLGNFFGILSGSKTRAVEFLSILAIGALFGVLLTQLFSAFKEKNQKT